MPTFQSTIHNDAKDEGEDEDNNEKEEDESDHIDKDEEVICVGDDDWSPYIVNVCVTNCFDIMLHNVVWMYSLDNLDNFKFVTYMWHYVSWCYTLTMYLEM